jgi:hypothetical protein
MHSETYARTLKIEVLREVAMGISAEFDRYEENAMNDEEKTLMDKAASEAWELADQLYGASNGRISEIEQQLQVLKKRLSEIGLRAAV